MYYFKVKELQTEQFPLHTVQKFLLNMIRDEFGYGFIPEYHQDIVDLETYYLEPERNNFFLAIHHETREVIGTMGIRAYDKNFPFFKDIYNPETTAGIWRVFVDNPWRRNGVASTLVHWGEKFCRKRGYEKIYLHTHKTISGSLDFWLSNGYRIVEDTGNQLKTVHMDKKIV